MKVRRFLQIDHVAGGRHHTEACRGATAFDEHAGVERIFVFVADHHVQRHFQPAQAALRL